MPIGNETNHTMDGLTVRGGLGIANNTGGVATVDYDRFAAMARSAVCMRGQGIFAETIPRGACATGTAGATGTIFAMSVGLLAGDVVSAMSVSQQTAGNTLTLVKLGLYSKTGTLLASSADVKANFLSTGLVTSTMTTPYTVLSDDLYWAVWLPVGTTTPAIMAAQGAINGFGAVGSAYPNVGTFPAQTDLVASATIAAAAGARCFWIGIS